MKTIFMTGGGGSGTIAATKELKKTGKYRIILGDMDKWAAGLKFADKAYILPPAADDNFIKVVKEIIDAQSVDVFIPLVDEEIIKSYQIKEQCSNVLVLLPNYDFAESTLDKWILVKKLKDNNLPSPKTFLSDDSGCDLKYPYIVKPRIGRGSRGVSVIENDNQLAAYKVLSSLSESQILLQKKIDGTEYTVSVVVDTNNKTIAVVPKEVIYKRGVTIHAVTRKNKAIEDICQEIVDKLQPCGPFNVQLILTKKGIPVIFEINPRYSTTIALTIAAGVNEIELLIQRNSNIKTPVPFKENLIMSRFYEQMYFQEGKL
ncbi:MAG: ATP-grasp domain-containing protein [Candidatus Omnitrophica bacterium]|nr:ATP-grasp domain-containing protein [Candidatus Omnitrophota bacterium]